MQILTKLPTYFSLNASCGHEDRDRSPWPLFQLMDDAAVDPRCSMETKDKNDAIAVRPPKAAMHSHWPLSPAIQFLCHDWLWKPNHLFTIFHLFNDTLRSLPSIIGKTCRLRPEIVRQVFSPRQAQNDRIFTDISCARPTREAHST